MRLVGRYQVGERIGEGATGDVFKAYDPRIDRVLAIKILKEGFRQNRQYAARFLREAKAAGALSHPNIVTIYDVGEVDGYPYIAMELLEGAPLDEVTSAGGGFAAKRVLEIGLQLAEALRYAHSMGVVHRDIKPSNVVLAPDGRGVKILDFGIARMNAADGAMAETLSTQIGQVVGTPRYMSPEQALGKDIDGRSDLFSVGAVLYELITGAKAFTAASPISLALQITQQDPPPITSLAPDCPEGLAFIVEKLLAKRADRRFPDGERLCEALRKELAALGTDRSEASGRSTRLPLQARAMLVMALATAVVLLLATGAVLNRQYFAMREMALTSGSAIAAFVADNAALSAADNASLPPTQRDWAPLQAFVRAASADPNVLAMTASTRRRAIAPCWAGVIFGCPPKRCWRAAPVVLSPTRRRCSAGLPFASSVLSPTPAALLARSTSASTPRPWHRPPAFREGCWRRWPRSPWLSSWPPATPPPACLPCPSAG
jgi:serine/threonine-protein kinase